MRKIEQFFDDRVIPIPLRPDVTIRIAHLPYDLTEDEARKIGRLVLALVEPVAPDPGGTQ